MADWVIPVRAGDFNPELRWMLRTLEANIPDHGDIWIVGYKPNWLTNVHHIPGNSSPHASHWNVNVYRNILAACEHPDIPDEFIVTNDDIMITQPVTEIIPVMHIGYLANQIAPIRAKPRTWWHHSLIFTHKVLTGAGYDNPISYELHVPLPVEKAPMAEALRRFIDARKGGIPPQWRTLYGNLNSIGGVQRKDTKARKAGPILKPFHSTSDSVWRCFRPYFQTHYPTPSRYEKT